ncbi:MAG: aminodeoxychorismate synthase component I [Nitrospinota bacterium]|nr:aminodeoxychorismate synthase component I [Nitrospinota bacterium]
MGTKTSSFKNHMRDGSLQRQMEWIAPERLFPAFAAKPGFIWLDSGRVMGGQSRWSFMMWSPEQVIGGRVGEFYHAVGDLPQRPIIDPFETLRDILSFGEARLPHDGYLEETGVPPFTGGAAGFFGYGLQTLTEPSTRLAGKAPSAEGDIWVGIYGAVAAFDQLKGELTLATSVKDSENPAVALDRMEEEILQAEAVTSNRSESVSSDSGKRNLVKSNFTREGFMTAVERVRSYIEQGDCYQANIAQRFFAEDTMDDTLYLKLREINPAPFGAYINTGAARILSVSPERFIRLRGDMAETMPVKGTRPRGRLPMEDNLLKLELFDSEKDRAENVMIVDLLRNDFSKVCLPHSVAAPDICRLEEHPTVFHLVSTVVGRLRPGLGPLDLLKSAFPGGSVTGAPKIRAMEIIDELEPDPRGAYCGAIGYIGYGGGMDTSVTIRTMVRADGKISFHAGGGITYSSDPSEEYQETLDKARALIEAVSW